MNDKIFSAPKNEAIYNTLRAEQHKWGDKRFCANGLCLVVFFQANTYEFDLFVDK